MAGRTKKAISAESGIPASTLFNMLNGHIAEGQNLAKLCAYFGVGETQLFLDPDLTKPTPVQALAVLADLFQRLGPEFVVRLAALDDTEIQGLREALSPGSTLDEARLRLNAKADDADENSG